MISALNIIRASNGYIVQITGQRAGKDQAEIRRNYIFERAVAESSEATDLPVMVDDAIVLWRNEPATP
jgi:hypothetical protein